MTENNYTHQESKKTAKDLASHIDNHPGSFRATAQRQKCPFNGFADCRSDCALRNFDVVTREDLGCCVTLLPVIEDELAAIAEHVQYRTK